MEKVKNWKQRVPMGLIFFRLSLAPIILGMTHYYGENAKPTILILMYLGLFSDIFDGIIARSVGVATAHLRRMDSQVDMIFWLSIGVATWWIYPNLIRENRSPVIAILCMEAACYIISFLRFGRETCTHAFLSKLFGIALLVGFTSLIGFNHAGLSFDFAIFMGIISHIDRILITLILPNWTHDIPSAYHAYLIRKGIPFRKSKLLN